MRRFGRALPVLKAALKASGEDRVPMMGAALAFYAVFSIAPLLVISMGVAGLVFGARGGARILDAVAGLAGDRAAEAVRAMVESLASRPRAGLFATVAGVITMLIGASGVFGQLQESLNVIWRARPPETAPWLAVASRRLLAFGMIGVLAFVLLVSLLASAALSAAGKYLAGALPGGETPWQILEAAISLTVVSGLFAVIYKVLPDARLPWRDAARGGLWTGLLFTIGKFALGLYLGRAGAASSYGAAGSVIALLLWIYYTAQIVLFGAELTYAYAGSVPAEGPRAHGEEHRRHAREHEQVRRHVRQRRALRHHRPRRVDEMGQRHRVGE